MEVKPTFSRKLPYVQNIKTKTHQILLNTNNVILDKLFVTRKLCSTFTRRHFGHLTKILGLDSLDLQVKTFELPIIIFVTKLGALLVLSLTGN